MRFSSAIKRTRTISRVVLVFLYVIRGIDITESLSQCLNFTITIVKAQIKDFSLMSRIIQIRQNFIFSSTYTVSSAETREVLFMRKQLVILLVMCISIISYSSVVRAGEYQQLQPQSFAYYKQFMGGNWNELKEIRGNEDSYIIEIYLDEGSLHTAGSFYEAWVKFRYNIDRVKDMKFDSAKSPPDVGTYYIRFDVENMDFYILAAHESLLDSTERKFVLNPPEHWDAESGKRLMDCMVNIIRAKYHIS